MAEKDENKTTVHDWTGLSQPLTKLIDVVAQAVGKHTSSYYRRKTVDDKAYELKRLATEFVDIQKLLPSAEFSGGQLTLPSKSEDDLSLKQRFEGRFDYQEARKQLNVESVTSNAMEELLSDPELEKNTNPVPVDPDWIDTFFQTVETVSDEQMQQLWGKVLAGEVKSPGSYSLRTLDTLRNITKNEAEIFRIIGGISITYEEKCFTPKFEYSFFKNKLRIEMQDIITLRDIGLVSSGKSLEKFSNRSADDRDIFYYANHIVMVTYTQKQKLLNLPVHYLSTVGAEMAKLLNPTFDIDFCRFAFQSFFKRNHKVMYRKQLLNIFDDFESLENLNDLY
jgi:Protein of unknown function (DUF2806)